MVDKLTEALNELSFETDKLLKIIRMKDTIKNVAFFVLFLAFVSIFIIDSFVLDILLICVMIILTFVQVYLYKKQTKYYNQKFIYPYIK